MPLSRKTNQEKVDQVAAAGARIITGCPAGIRSRVVMAEADIRSISSLADEQGAILRERILRLPPDIPARKTVTRKIRKRLKTGRPGEGKQGLPGRHSWRRQRGRSPRCRRPPPPVENSASTFTPKQEIRLFCKVGILAVFWSF